jgi:hypothetical protein
VRHSDVAADGLGLFAAGNASINVSDIGIDALMPVVVVTPLSTTSRRSAT